MRPSIVNCVSTAAKMMRFSDESLFRSGHPDFDYVVVTWLPSDDVRAYLAELPAIAKRSSPGTVVHVVEHATDESIGYVPNLRAMMNRGFSVGFELNEYAGLVNTDVYFGVGWLAGLVKYAAEHRVINSLHITAASPPKPVYGIITKNLGPPLPEVFDLDGFHALYQGAYRQRMVKASELGGDHRQVATMPYLFHRKYWEQCGPWELTLDKGVPDMRFFARVSAAGAEFALSEESIIYHHEAVERRGKRPAGAERMTEE